MLARILAMLILAAVPAAADPVVCAPPPGQRLAVVGVAEWDRLNVRTGPGVANAILGSLAPHADFLSATGRVGFLTQLCRVACDQYRAGVADFAAIVQRDCLGRSQIWYELRAPGGLAGWSSARYLELRTAAPPPGTQPPSPGGGDGPVISPPFPDPAARVLYFDCADGERLRVTLREETQDALVRLAGGREFVLRRMPAPGGLSYVTTAFGGLSLEGDRTAVYWKGPGAQGSTRCLART